MALKCLPPLLKATGSSAPKAPGWAAQHTNDSAARGYGHAWRKARQRVMQRDCGLCQPCQALGRASIAHAVDHIVPKFEGGGEQDGNLQAICNDCHAAKTAAESKRARGYG